MKHCLMVRPKNKCILSPVLNIDRLLEALLALFYSPKIVTVEKGFCFVAVR